MTCWVKERGTVEWWPVYDLAFPAPCDNRVYHIFGKASFDIYDVSSLIRSGILDITLVEML